MVCVQNRPENCTNTPATESRCSDEVGWRREKRCDSLRDDKQLNILVDSTLTVGRRAVCCTVGLLRKANWIPALARTAQKQLDNGRILVPVDQWYWAMVRDDAERVSRRPMSRLIATILFQRKLVYCLDHPTDVSLNFGHAKLNQPISSMRTMCRVVQLRDRAQAGM